MKTRGPCKYTIGDALLFAHKVYGESEVTRGDFRGFLSESSAGIGEAPEIKQHGVAYFLDEIVAAVALLPFRGCLRKLAPVEDQEKLTADEIRMAWIFDVINASNRIKKPEGPFFYVIFKGKTRINPRGYGYVTKSDLTFSNPILRAPFIVINLGELTKKAREVLDPEAWNE